MTQQILSGEETFARIFYDVEKLGLPIYHDMIFAIIAYGRDEKAACARYIANITARMRLVLGSYFENMHDKMIAQSVWLSHIQGFYGWGLGHYDEGSGAWEKFDGLSGNQVLLFQALDAFLGIDQYLTPRDQERNVPKRQRELCHVLRKYSFRGSLSAEADDQDEVAIVKNLNNIVKRLRVREHQEFSISFFGY